MKRRDFSTLLATTSVLGAAAPAFAQGGPVDGRHFYVLAQPLPTPAG